MARRFSSSYCPVSASVSRHCDEDESEDMGTERARCIRCGRYFQRPVPMRESQAVVNCGCIYQEIAK
jgi:hypothetical protein